MEVKDKENYSSKSSDLLDQEENNFKFNNDHYNSIYEKLKPFEDGYEIHESLKGKMENGDFNDPYTYIHEINGASEEILIFIVHGIGQNSEKLSNSITKIKDSVIQLYKKNSAFLNKQIHFRMIDWKQKIKKKSIDLLLNNNKNTSMAKKLLHDIPLDLIFYLGNKNKFGILNDVIHQMNSYYYLATKFRKFFQGSVSCIGHSLGSVMLYDILSRLRYSNNIDYDKIEKENQISNEIFIERKNSKCFNKSTNIEEKFDYDFKLISETNKKDSEMKQSKNDKELLNNYEKDKFLLSDLITINFQNITFKKLEGDKSYVSNSSDEENLKKKAKEVYVKSLLCQEKYIFDDLFLDKKIISLDKNINPLIFGLDHFFLTGSPLGLFVAVDGDDDPKLKKLSTVKDIHNIMHPMDPIAYRIEPLINNYPNFEKGFILPHWENDGIRKPFLSSLFKVLCLEASNEDDNLKFNNSKSKKRYDFLVQESPTEKAINMVGVLTSHQGYWNNLDVFYFILKMCHWQGYCGVEM